MSIANLYGKTPNTLASVDTRTASKQYIPGGVMLSSAIFEPVNGVVTGAVANGRKIKLFYTKIGNQVTISCRIFISDTVNPAVVGDAISTFTGIAGQFGRFTDANLGADIIAQMNNDILVKDGNNAGAIDPVQLRIPGIFSNETTGNAAFLDLLTDQMRVCGTAVADSPLLANLYAAGGVSFLAQNSAIVV